MAMTLAITLVMSITSIGISEQAVADAGHNHTGNEISGSSSKYPIVTVQKVQNANDTPFTIEVAGEILPVEEGSIYAIREGIVQSLSANIGNRVKKGQILAYLYPDMEQATLSAELRLKEAESEGIASKKQALLSPRLPVSGLSGQSHDQALSQIVVEKNETASMIEALRSENTAEIQKITTQIANQRDKLAQQSTASFNRIFDLTNAINDLLYRQPDILTQPVSSNDSLYRRTELSARQSTRFDALDDTTREFYKTLSAQASNRSGNTIDMTHIQTLLSGAVSLGTDARLLSNNFVATAELNEVAISELKEKLDTAIDHLLEQSGELIDTITEQKNLEAEKAKLQITLTQKITELETQKNRNIAGIQTDLQLLASDYAGKLIGYEIERQIKQAEIHATRQKMGAGRTVIAPFDGVITRRYVNVGDSVNLEKPLFEIISQKRSFVRFFVNESDFPFIRSGTEITFSPTFQPSKQYQAKVTRISQALDSATRTILAEADIDSRQDTSGILPHMTVRTHIPVTLGASLLTIPEKALELSGSSDAVWIVSPEVLTEKKDISIEFIRNGIAYVRSGLEQDQWIITKSPVKLTPLLPIDTKI